MARAFLFLLAGLLASAHCACAYDLVLSEPEEVFKTEGGSVKRWDPSGALQCAGMDAVDFTLEPGGLALPKYQNQPALAYVLEGSAQAVMTTPFGPANLRRMTRGDVVAIPEGFVFGAHNDGKERFRLLAVGDRTTGQVEALQDYTSFFLFGNPDDKRAPSVLNGFSKDVLAATWNVDEASVEKLLTSQKGAAIIKLEKHARAPTPDTWFGDFSFSLRETQPELVTKGGVLNFVTEYKMPILKEIGLSAAVARLEPNAIFAPSWSPNSHRIVYFTGGRGRVQVATPLGKNAVDKEVKEGDLLVVPKHFPATKLAARDSPLEWVSIQTSAHPTAYFLAGANSVFKSFPFELLVAGFNVDPELEKRVLQAHTDETIILTRPEKAANHVEQSFKSAAAGHTLARELRGQIWVPHGTGQRD